LTRPAEEELEAVEAFAPGTLPMRSMFSTT
jgi:hypothetical protein